jgi:hypothetical protein
VTGRKPGFGRGLPAYCALIALLKKPATITGLASTLCGGYSEGSRAGVSRAMRELRAAGLAHISGWTHCRKDKRGPLASVWSLGPGGDAKRPSGLRMPLGVERIRPEMLAFVEAIRCVQEGPATVKEIRERSGLGKGPILTFTKLLREAGLLHIGEWEVSGQIRAPSWVWGGGKDAPKPPPKTRAEIDRAYEARARLKRQQRQILYALAANDSMKEAA